MRDCTITKNNAAIGGGVASYGNFTSLTIDGCTITGNKAANYGGGFAAESNSGEGAGTTITNTKLCNNSADKAASDVYLDGSRAKLSAAKGMNELYLGKPDDVTNKKIDGWYLDNENARYATQTKEQRIECANYASIGSDGKVYLIAAAKPSLVKITFANEDGTTIYSEDWYEIGTKAAQITAPTPTKPSDDKYDYVVRFMAQGNHRRDRRCCLQSPVQEGAQEQSGQFRYRQTRHGRPGQQHPWRGRLSN